MTDKLLLIKQATSLVRLGRIVETKKKQLSKLYNDGVSLTDMELFRALDEYNIAKQEWDKLEQEHLDLRRKYDG